jgi:hypothetical protein
MDKERSFVTSQVLLLLIFLPITLVIGGLIFEVGSNAQETINLDSAVQTDAGETRFRVVFISIDRECPCINVRLRGANPDGSLKPDGKVVEKSYNGTTAVTFMNQLNTANLAITSLERRVLQRLQTDGVIGSGTISGTPP